MSNGYHDWRYLADQRLSAGADGTAGRVARHVTCSYCNRSRVALYRDGALIGWANDDGTPCPSDQAAINRAWSMLGPELRRILAQAMGLPPETIPTVAEIEIHNANEEP